MVQAFYMDENGTEKMLEIPDNATNLTESLNSSRTVGFLLKQHEEQCKQKAVPDICCYFAHISGYPWCINPCIQ